MYMKKNEEKSFGIERQGERVKKGFLIRKSTKIFKGFRYDIREIRL